MHAVSPASPPTAGFDSVGHELHALATRLFPLFRSQTGDGVRETLAILGETIPIETHEVPTGTPVFDWVVPQEWTFHDAYVADDTGRRVIDARVSNLHLVNGSAPVRTSLPWSALKPRLHTVPDQPDRIPYRTAFFKDDWGFCLSQNEFDALDAAGERTYDVVVDTTLTDGALTYGACVVPGESTDEVLLYAHICHPSLANDNLSGLSIAALLARHLMALRRRRLTYRIVFAPATIGAITWLAMNEEALPRIKHGLVLSLLGDPGPFTYKRSRRGDAAIDRAAEHVLSAMSKPSEVRDFVPWGYDERQFCSPGIDLPMGCLMRTANGEFAEYHTSGDDLSFITPEALGASFQACLDILDVIENDAVYRNLRPFGEPRLGQYGLYESLPEDADRRSLQYAVQWVLNLSDGRHSLLAIAQRARMPFATIHDAATRLEACGLLAREDGAAVEEPRS